MSNKIENKLERSQAQEKRPSSQVPFDVDARQRSAESDAQAEISYSEYHGPLPPPHLLAEYEQITPGLAMRIVEMAEVEGRHRREMELSALELEKAALKQHGREVTLGQIFAFFIAMMAIVAGSYVAINSQAVGQQIAGGAIGSLGIGGIVLAFIKGRSQSANGVAEKETKAPKSAKSQRK